MEDAFDPGGIGASFLAPSDKLPTDRIVDSFSFKECGILYRPFRFSPRLARLRVGLLGDWKSVGAGVYELRIDHGSGYWVYFGLEGKTLVLLLCGGDKRTQMSDIEKAHGYWKDHKARTALKPPVQGVESLKERKRHRRLH